MKEIFLMVVKELLIYCWIREYAPEAIAMEPSINQEGFGGSGGIGSFDLWPLSFLKLSGSFGKGGVSSALQEAR